MADQPAWRQRLAQCRAVLLRYRLSRTQKKLVAIEAANVVLMQEIYVLHNKRRRLERELFNLER